MRRGHKSSLELVTIVWHQVLHRLASALFHHCGSDTAYLLKLGSGRIENACGGSAAAPIVLLTGFGNVGLERSVLGPFWARLGLSWARGRNIDNTSSSSSSIK